MMKDDKFFWFKENRIVIPGVKGEHVFMHLTDSHIDVVDELSTPEEREKYDYQHELWAKYKKVFADKNNEPYGEPQMIPMLEAFEKALALAEELQPEALLIHGRMDRDTPAYNSVMLKKIWGERAVLRLIEGADHCYQSDEANRLLSDSIAEYIVNRRKL